MAFEITVPDTTPETEWIRGRPLQKMSPKRDHARLQAILASALLLWAKERGEVGTEWRFRIEPPGEARRPLVPDLAYVAYERLRGFSHDELQAPPFAPTVAIEILSPGDRAADVAAKVLDLVRAGCELVIVLDPKQRSATFHVRDAPVRTLSGDDVLRHEALPGFELALAPFFSEALDLKA